MKLKFSKINTFDRIQTLILTVADNNSCNYSIYFGRKTLKLLRNQTN